jgi:hypothetical protein
VGRRSLHRVSGRSNPIELTFATIGHRTKVTKGPGSKAAGIAMAFRLIEAAQERWRAVNAPHLVALVRAGAASNTASSLNATPYSRPPKPPTIPLVSRRPPPSLARAQFKEQRGIAAAGVRPLIRALLDEQAHDLTLLSLCDR